MDPAGSTVRITEVALGVCAPVRLRWSGGEEPYWIALFWQDALGWRGQSWYAFNPDIGRASQAGVQEGDTIGFNVSDGKTWDAWDVVVPVGFMDGTCPQTRAATPVSPVNKSTAAASSSAAAPTATAAPGGGAAAGAGAGANGNSGSNPALSSQPVPQPPGAGHAGTSKSSAPIGAIVGGVVGGIAALALLLIAFLLYRRQAARNHKDSESARDAPAKPPPEAWNDKTGRIWDPSTDFELRRSASLSVYSAHPFSTKNTLSSADASYGHSGPESARSSNRGHRREPSYPRGSDAGHGSGGSGSDADDEDIDVEGYLTARRRARETNPFTTPEPPSDSDRGSSLGHAGFGSPNPSSSLAPSSLAPSSSRATGAPSIRSIGSMGTFGGSGKGSGKKKIKPPRKPSSRSVRSVATFGASTAGSHTSIPPPLPDTATMPGWESDLAPRMR